MRTNSAAAAVHVPIKTEQEGEIFYLFISLLSFNSSEGISLSRLRLYDQSFRFLRLKVLEYYYL